METPMKKDDNKTTTKKVWQKPELIAYGSVEDITLKGYGVNDGVGLGVRGSHPSM